MSSKPKPIRTAAKKVFKSLARCIILPLRVLVALTYGVVRIPGRVMLRAAMAVSKRIRRPPARPQPALYPPPRPSALSYDVIRAAVLDNRDLPLREAALHAQCVHYLKGHLDDDEVAKLQELLTQRRGLQAAMVSIASEGVRRGVLPREAVLSACSGVGQPSGETLLNAILIGQVIPMFVALEDAAGEFQAPRVWLANVISHSRGMSPSYVRLVDFKRLAMDFGFLISDSARNLDFRAASPEEMELSPTRIPIFDCIIPENDEEFAAWDSAEAMTSSLMFL